MGKPDLFAGKYERTVSFWQGTQLSAYGIPTNDKEKTLLAPFPKAVHHAIMASIWRPTVTDGSSQDRKVLKAAFDLFKTAGYMLQDSKMLDREGRLFAFEILTSSEAEQRMAAVYQRTLEKLSTAVTIQALEADQIQTCKQRFDFDVLIGAIGVSVTLLPGIEQNSFWGGSSTQSIEDLLQSCRCCQSGHLYSYRGHAQSARDGLFRCSRASAGSTADVRTLHSSHAAQ